jgi:GTP-binding protein EngB required for normal cell division
VVIFGETGVGKSSLVNMVAGREVSATSSGAVGCTLEYKQHVMDLGNPNQRFAVWDTAGLDEGTYGTVPAEKAEVYLKQLLRDLAKTSGIDLLVYCVRGTRVRSALLSNYDLFYSAICRKKVPIAIVVTGLENQEGSMESWWEQNQHEFSALKMHFDNHACVTTVTPLEPLTQNTTLGGRLGESKVAVINLITTTCRAQKWKPAERSWIETASSDIRAMLSPKDNIRPANVILCHVSPSDQHTSGSVATRRHGVSFHNPVALSFSLRPVTFRNPISIVNERMLPLENTVKSVHERSFCVYQVPQKCPDEESKKAVKRGADLLIFCVDMEHHDIDVKSQWEHFYFTYGGDLSPQIVVVIGASDQASAKDWWENEMGTPTDANVTFWHTSQVGEENEATKKCLQDLIISRCISFRKVFMKNEHVFKRSLRVDTGSWIFAWTKAQNISGQDGEQDILTQWGVWEEVPPIGGGTPVLQSPSQELNYHGALGLVHRES